MGAITPVALRTYPDGFPEEVVEQLRDATGRGVLCNRPYSGSAVIDDFGEEHLRTGDLIVYTSADSVLQIAAHEDEVPQAELYAACAAAREIMRGEHAVGRVIARPFRGAPGAFERTEGRKDLALDPPGALVSRRAPGRRDPGPHGGQDRLGVQPRRRRPRAPGRDEPGGDRRDDRADRRARARLRLHQPRRDRPGLRPPPGRPRLPRRAAGDRRRGGGVARAAGPGARPARAHGRPRLRPDDAGHRPHARARPAAGRVRRPRRPPARRPVRRRRRRACCAGSPAASAARCPGTPFRTDAFADRPATSAGDGAAPVLAGCDLAVAGCGGGGAGRRGDVDAAPPPRQRAAGRQPPTTPAQIEALLRERAPRSSAATPPRSPAPPTGAQRAPRPPRGAARRSGCRSSDVRLVPEPRRRSRATARRMRGGDVLPRARA